jgi:hypothetical protein
MEMMVVLAGMMALLAVSMFLQHSTLKKISVSK